MKQIIAEAWSGQVRIALVQDSTLLEYAVEYEGEASLLGNVYKGRVQNVLPGMQAAFVDIGLAGKNAYLPLEEEFYDAEFVNREELQTPLVKQFKQGQELLVQVVKEPGGDKGVRVRRNIGLPGRALVLLPTVSFCRVSRRIEDEKERERLHEIAEKIVPEGMGMIIRTGAEGLQEFELKEDLAGVQKIWNTILKKEKTMNAPCLLYREEDLLFQYVRDVFLPDVDRFVVSDHEMLEKVKSIVAVLWPERIKDIQCAEDRDVFTYFQLEEKVAKLSSKKIWLKCGGYIIIDETEALTVVDVNSGKYIGSNELEETACDINVEAAAEIAKQLRLRDIAGAIVIDFISMSSAEHQNRVLCVLQEGLKADRTRSKVLGFTALGLVEMTRKRTKQKLSTHTTKQCAMCRGEGKEELPQVIGLQILKQAYRIFKHTNHQKVWVQAHPEVVNYLQKIVPNDSLIEGSGALYLQSKAHFMIKDFAVEGMTETQIQEKTCKTDAVILNFALTR